jgi:L-lactate dehydrogenase complex protein LldG
MSKSAILETIRKNRPAQSPLPEISRREEKTSQFDLQLLFKERLEQVGGQFVEATEKGAVEKFLLTEHPEALDFSKIEIRERFMEDYSLDKAYSVGTVVLKGRVGVAENGAVWLEDVDFPVRLLPFVTQQLILRLDGDRLVSTMHEAYQRIHLENTGFGVFISGPSKTADIEQSLVFGAHGAKELIVIVENY